MVGEWWENLRKWLDHFSIASLPHSVPTVVYARNHGEKAAIFLQNPPDWHQFPAVLVQFSAILSQVQPGCPLDKTIDSLYNKYIVKSMYSVYTVGP